MNVRELIKQLSQLDPELPIVYEQIDISGDNDYEFMIVPEIEALIVKNKDGQEKMIAFLKQDGVF